jgi:DNA-binding response OmpR family regulator
VTAVSCPLRALEADVSQFHLAILDFDMSALNGFQLLLRLRAAHYVLKLPRQRRTDTYFAG